MKNLNRSNMEYWSVKDAAALVGKSESSIKRLVSTIKNSSPNKYKDLKYFRFEKLKNGVDKVYLSTLLLEESFTWSNTDSMTYSETSSMTGSNESVKDEMIALLKNELSERNKTIDSLIERNREQNVLMLDLKSRLELSEPKRNRWFFFNRKDRGNG